MDEDGDIGISRQSLENGQLRDMIAQSGWSHLLLDEAQLHASLEAVRPPSGACWVFAYGSLMWNPVFHPVERRQGVLHGYHRRFCFWIHAGRATPQHPGLMMGLLPGGTCRGVLLRMDCNDADLELALLWKREMVTGAYIPRRLPVRTPEGPVEAIVFLANPRHPTFAGDLPFCEVARAIAGAAGPLGRNRDYLRRTVETLRHQGIPDCGLEKLAREVSGACSASG
ncbi:MAG: gamma-glutamylcyclotransferase [Rhodospirillaceae bacterium]|nr:gamma-glutamylcyclotransferase [Rhodospirillales bacterium]